MSEHTCEIEFRVRYEETDQMGCVHHSKYAIYFEMGRTELLRTSGVSYRQMEETGSFFVVAKLEVNYRLPARYDDVLRLVTTATRTTPARVEHDYELYRKTDGVLLTKAHTVLACVDREGKLMAIPEAFMGKIASA